MTDRKPWTLPTPETKTPVCEECDEPMHRYSTTLLVHNVSGWCCDLCGWSWDDEPVTKKGK